MQNSWAPAEEGFFFFANLSLVILVYRPRGSPSSPQEVLTKKGWAGVASLLRGLELTSADLYPEPAMIRIPNKRAPSCLHRSDQMGAV